MKPTTYSEFDNYRWVNCNRWSTAQEVDSLVDHLVKGISREVGRLRINMKALVLDLYEAYLCDPEQYIAYYRSKGSYYFAGSDHPYIKNNNISYTHFLGCADHLKRKNYLIHKVGCYFRPDDDREGGSYVSKMRATSELIALVREYGITPEMIDSFCPEEVIRLRGPEKEEKYVYKGEVKTRTVKPPRKVPPGKVVTQMTKEVKAYNALLERTSIDVDIECMTAADRDALVQKIYDMNGPKRVILKLSKKSVYRVFNNGSLEEGGRYYGAWWVSAPSIVRKYITLDGEPTVEMDFSGMHVHLLYAVKRINYADRKEDPYILNDGVPDRNLNKLILLTAFNAKTAEKAASAVWDELRKNNKLKDYGLTSYKPIRAKLDLLKLKHAPISDMIAHDWGRKLQYYDSCVISGVIAYFADIDVPILTVHDSVVCRAKDQERVKNIMWRYYAKAVDELVALSLKVTPLYSRAGFILNQLNQSSQLKTPPSVMGPMLQHNRIKSDRYHGRISDAVTNILAVKITSRTNSCSKTCSHSIRSSNKLKYRPSIRLQPKELRESSSVVLDIKL